MKDFPATAGGFSHLLPAVLLQLSPQNLSSCHKEGFPKESRCALFHLDSYHCCGSALFSLRFIFDGFWVSVSASDNTLILKAFIFSCLMDCALKGVSTKVVVYKVVISYFSQDIFQRGVPWESCLHLLWAMFQPQSLSSEEIQHQHKVWP